MRNLQSLRISPDEAVSHLQNVWPEQDWAAEGTVVAERASRLWD